jgi:hypothetical protein
MAQSSYHGIARAQVFLGAMDLSPYIVTIAAPPKKLNPYISNSMDTFTLELSLPKKLRDELWIQADESRQFAYIRYWPLYLSGGLYLVFPVKLLQLSEPYHWTPDVEVELELAIKSGLARKLIP